MILSIALLFTIACVVASARRLQLLFHATPIDAAALAGGLRPLREEVAASVLPSLGRALAEVEDADWERDVVVAAGEVGDARSALLAEAMTELDFRTHRWVRVPRVAASLASSFGFLLATVALRVGLAGVADTLDEALILSANGAVLDALDVGVVGLVGAAFCVAVQYRARAALSARSAGAERLVELLEGLKPGDGGPLADDRGHASVAWSQSPGALPSPVA